MESKPSCCESLYLHFMLVNIWSEPYGEKRPIRAFLILRNLRKNALVDYQRGTVNEVYAQIEKDLKLGISLVSDIYYKHPKFHFNKKAAYAFASRFYLMKGEWEEGHCICGLCSWRRSQDTARPWRQYADVFEFNHRSLYRRYAAASEPANLLLTTTESRLARTTPSEKYGSTFNTVDKIFCSKGH